jgi:hypothetical protein
MKKWLVFEADGRMHQILTGTDEDPPLGHEVIEVSRHTTDPECEHYDRGKGKWEKDTAKRAKIDKEHKRNQKTRGALAAEVEELTDRVAALEAIVAKLA